LPISGFTSGGTLTVSVAKTGFNISGTPKTVAIYYLAPIIAVTFQSLTANGSSSQTTTDLTLSFSGPISGLGSNDITLSGVSGITKGTLTGSNPYTLPISGFSAGGTLTVSLAKTGFNISGTPKTIAIYYIAPTIEVTFQSLTANGYTPQTITELTLTFSAPISGLSSNDIHLYIGVSAVESDITKGTLTGSNPYTLPISGVTSSILNVRVEKTGYAISGFPKSVEINEPPPITEITHATLASYLATLPTNTASLPHNITLKVSSAGEFSIINSALSSAWNKFVNLDLTGSTVTIIGDDAFKYCQYLTSITIPSGVISIGSQAFFMCSRLTSVTIPNSVTSIGEMAFSECASLTSVTIPNSVISIGDHAFDSCTTLASVTIGSSVTSIGKNAFYWCNSLTSVTIPKSVTSIGQNAFWDCNSLVSVTFQGTIPYSGFTSSSQFPGNLRSMFYVTDIANGTPATYTRPNGSSLTWTRQ
jgi:hypothetical protein